MERESFPVWCRNLSPTFCSIYATNEMGLTACFSLEKGIDEAYKRTIIVQLKKLMHIYGATTDTIIIYR